MALISLKLLSLSEDVWKPGHIVEAVIKDCPYNISGGTVYHQSKVHL